MYSSACGQTRDRLSACRHEFAGAPLLLTPRSGTAASSASHTGEKQGPKRGKAVAVLMRSAFPCSSRLHLALHGSCKGQRRILAGPSAGWGRSPGPATPSFPLQAQLQSKPSNDPRSERAVCPYLGQVQLQSPGCHSGAQRPPSGRPSWLTKGCVTVCGRAWAGCPPGAADLRPAELSGLLASPPACPPGSCSRIAIYKFPVFSPVRARQCKPAAKAPRSPRNTCGAPRLAHLPRAPLAEGGEPASLQTAQFLHS